MNTVDVYRIEKNGCGPFMQCTIREPQDSMDPHSDALIAVTEGRGFDNSRQAVEYLSASHRTPHAEHYGIAERFVYNKTLVFGFGSEDDIHTVFGDRSIDILLEAGYVINCYTFAVGDDDDTSGRGYERGLPQKCITRGITMYQYLINPADALFVSRNVPNEDNL